MWKEEISQDELLQKAAELKKNGSKPGCDGMSAKSAELWITINGQRLLSSFFRGNYEPMPADGFRVAKSNGSFRTLTRMTAIDLILQKCLLDAVQADCEGIFSDFSYAYRSMRGVNAALQKYCEYGSAYRLVAKIDPIQCFDNMDYLLGSYLPNRPLRSPKVTQEQLNSYYDVAHEEAIKNVMACLQRPETGKLIRLIDSVFTFCLLRNRYSAISNIRGLL